VRQFSPEHLAALAVTAVALVVAPLAPLALWTGARTTHCGVVVAAVLLVFGLGIRPRPGAVGRAFAATLLMAAAAGAADLLTGGNSMFLRAKPTDASLLDLMGPWPLYIASAAALALILFALLYALARHDSPPWLS